ncbi:MAG: thiamine biosynthesis protein ApbE [Flavobacteriaceae bacterium]|nr:MAG: thiamine biosynthesis protein ApbE [Flavobacteriaceae bacterium]
MQKISLLLSILFLISCSDKELKYQKISGNAFGTTYNIIYKDSQNKNFEKNFDSLIYVVNKSMSIYLPNSDISKINQGDTSILIDNHFKKVFLKSQRIFKETDGYFDPTVGGLVNAWGFGPDNSIANLTDSKVDSLLQFVGFDKVKLIDGKIVKEHPAIYFDFNAIAKGYGIDVIGRYLESQNCTNYLIELGGEIRARGVNDLGDFWHVAIEDPNTDGTRSISEVVSLENKTMASSGNYRKFKVDSTDKKYVHTINAKTGYAIESNLLAATVISDLDCADVDAYATSFMAMGFEKSKIFLEKHPELTAHLIYVDVDGETKKVTLN